VSELQLFFSSFSPVHFCHTWHYPLVAYSRAVVRHRPQKTPIGCRKLGLAIRIAHSPSGRSRRVRMAGGLV
jgi:hypothetical protein